MQTPKSAEPKMPDLLSARRDQLFQAFLEKPSNVELIGEIRRIEACIAELTRRSVSEQESPYD